MGPATGTRTRIIVVDDEPSIVDAVSTALRYEGHEVAAASTGQRTSTLRHRPRRSVFG